MFALTPTPPDYLQGFDDFGLQKWYQYQVNLSMDSDYSSTGSTQENGFSNGAEMVYNSLYFAGIISANPEGRQINTQNFPTRRKRLINTGYNNGVARTAQAIKCNFLLNKNFIAGSNLWGTDLTITIPVEFSESGGGSSAHAHTCILKKVSTGGTVTTLKTLTLVNTTTIGIMRYYTFSLNGAIGSTSAGDLLYIEYILTYTAPGFTNSGYYSNLSILTNGLTNLFASIP